MWKAQLGRAIKEVRFVLKPATEHHGTWRFVETKLPQLKMLNQNTFFSLSEIGDNFKSKSACHIIYGDRDNTEDYIETANLSPEAFEEALKSKVAHGLTLSRQLISNNSDRKLPRDVVEARNHIQYLDDEF